MLTDERKKAIKDICKAIDHIEDVKFIPSRIGHDGQIICMRSGRTINSISIDADGTITNGSPMEVTPEELAYIIMTKLNEEDEVFGGNESWVF